MNEAQKKIVAVISAVMQYLQAEEEMAALPFTTEDAAPVASSGPKLWALNGRQSQMQIRNLMQLRAFGRLS